MWSPGGGTQLKSDGYVPTGISNKGAIGTEYLRAKKGVFEYQHISNRGSFSIGRVCNRKKGGHSVP